MSDILNNLLKVFLKYIKITQKGVSIMWGSLIGVVANSVKTAVGGTVRKGFSGGRKQLSSYRKTTKSRGSWGFGKMVTGRRSTKRRGFGGKSPSFNKVGNVLRHFFF